MVLYYGKVCEKLKRFLTNSDFKAIFKINNKPKKFIIKGKSKIQKKEKHN